MDPVGPLQTFINMDREMQDGSWNRALTPSERRFAIGIVAWFAACVFTAIISPKLGVLLLALGVLVTAIVMLAIHIAS